MFSHTVSTVVLQVRISLSIRMSRTTTLGHKPHDCGVVLGSKRQLLVIFDNGTIRF